MGYTVPQLVGWSRHLLRSATPMGSPSCVVILLCQTLAQAAYYLSLVLYVLTSTRLLLAATRERGPVFD